MLQIETAFLLEEFRAIKLPVECRKMVDGYREKLQRNGDLLVSEKSEIRNLAKRYKKQLDALRLAREKAGRTVALKKLGLTISEANRRAAERKKKIEESKNDFGF